MAESELVTKKKNPRGTQGVSQTHPRGGEGDVGVTERALRETGPTATDAEGKKRDCIQTGRRDHGRTEGGGRNS